MTDHTSQGHAAEPALEKRDAWNSLLTALQEQLGPQIFDSWFRAIECDGVDEALKQYMFAPDALQKTGSQIITPS